MPVALFDIVPDNFFNVFTSIDKGIYIETLLLLYDEFKESNYMLTKSESAIALGRFFDKKIFDFQNESEEVVLKNKTISEYSYAILRYLIKYGWLEEQNDLENLEVYLSMPPFASALLETIHKIMHPDNSRTENCVLNVYLNLKEITLAGSSENIFLENAYQDTTTLNRLLQDIIHGMKVHFDNLLKQVSLANVLAEHFFEYERNINDKSYHPLKTENNAFKYRNEITKIIKELRYNDELQEKIAKQMKLNKNLDSDEDARNMVSRYLDEILKTFDNISGKLNQIDRKHTQYLNASWDRCRYLSSRDKDLPANLANIIDTIVESNDDPTYIKEVSKSLRLNGFQSLGERSLYTPRSGKVKFNPQATKIEKMSDNDIASSREKIVKENSALNSEFSIENVKRYLEGLLNGNTSVNTRDIIIADTTELIKLILALDMAGKANSEFKATVFSGNVHVNEFNIPEILFERKTTHVF